MAKRDGGEQVVLLTEDARSCGTAPKLAAHQPPGRAHLAFSVVLTNPDGLVLLQQRSRSKHHFQGCWANTCCSHPQPGESLRNAARRRLRQELGLRHSGRLDLQGGFWYQATDPSSGLVEIEYDLVLLGTVTPPFDLDPDPAEVERVRWATRDEITALGTHGQLAPWLPGVLGLLDQPRTGIEVPIPW